MKYAQDEKVVSSWNYAFAKRGNSLFGSTDEYNLTVTNKRIIYGKEVKNGFDRTEIMLDSVKGVNIEYRSSNLLAYVLIAFGLASLIIGFLLFASRVFGSQSTYAILIAVLIGIILILQAIRFMGQRVEVKLYLTCVKQPFAAVNKGSGTKMKQITKIKIRKDIFKDLKESLSALLLNV